MIEALGKVTVRVVPVAMPMLPILMLRIHLTLIRALMRASRVALTLKKVIHCKMSISRLTAEILMILAFNRVGS